MGYHEGEISVVILNWNDGAYLPALIKSYLSQSTHLREIIIVDDPSTDSSLDIIVDLANENQEVQCNSLSRNVGPCGAVTKGLAAVTSEVVALTPANDIVDAEFLGAAVSVVLEHPDSAFCFSDPGEVPKDGIRRESYSYALSVHPRYFRPDEIEKRSNDSRSLFRRIRPSTGCKESSRLGNSSLSWPVMLTGTRRTASQVISAYAISLETWHTSVYTSAPIQRKAFRIFRLAEKFWQLCLTNTLRMIALFPTLLKGPESSLSTMLHCYRSSSITQTFVKFCLFGILSPLYPGIYGLLSGQPDHMH